MKTITTCHDFENMTMTDNQFELFQMAKNWHYDSNHGYSEEIISSLYDLLVSIDEAATKEL